MPIQTLSDEELWATAHYVMKHSGEDAPVFIAERLGLMAANGDAKGIATWQAIAKRVDDLMRKGTVQ